MQVKIHETTLFAELVKTRNMRELEASMKSLQKAYDKANQDDVQIIEGGDEKSEEKARGGGVDVVDIPVPTTDGENGKTPPLPVAATRLSTPCVSVNNSPGVVVEVPLQPPPLPPMPPAQEMAHQVPAPVPPIPVPAPPPANAMPNLSVPPPPIPVPIHNSFGNKFNSPNNLISIKMNDPPKPPIVEFKTKSLKKLPMPPGIDQNDLESIDSPPSRSPSPPKVTMMVRKEVPITPLGVGKLSRKRGIKDLPMPPG